MSQTHLTLLILHEVRLWSVWQTPRWDFWQPLQLGIQGSRWVWLPTFGFKCRLCLCVFTNYNLRFMPKEGKEFKIKLCILRSCVNAFKTKSTLRVIIRVLQRGPGALAHLCTTWAMTWRSQVLFQTSIFSTVRRGDWARRCLTLFLDPTFQDSLDANSMEFVDSRICCVGPTGIEKVLKVLAPRMTSVADQRPEPEVRLFSEFICGQTDSKMSLQQGRCIPMRFVVALQSLSRARLCDSMNCRAPNFPVLHHLLELAQIHVHELVMSSNHLILCHPLLLLPSVSPSIRISSNESALRIRWPKY